jgi:hypothetical protein
MGNERKHNYSAGNTMKKNVASQLIGVQMITAADGTDFTGSITCTIAKDGAAPVASAGTGPTHQATGYYEYNPTQAETNYDHIAFHFTGTGAISTTVQVYTDTVTGDVANILVDTGVLTDGIITGTAGSTSLSTTGCSSNLTGYTNDQLIGRIITFLAGPADGESSDITDYVATNGVITFTALTLAPQNGNAFKIT